LRHKQGASFRVHHGPEAELADKIPSTERLVPMNSVALPVGQLVVARERLDGEWFAAA